MSDNVTYWAATVTQTVKCPFFYDIPFPWESVKAGKWCSTLEGRHCWNVNRNISAAIQGRSSTLIRNDYIEHVYIQTIEQLPPSYHASYLHLHRNRCNSSGYPSPSQFYLYVLQRQLQEQQGIEVREQCRQWNWSQIGTPNGANRRNSFKRLLIRKIKGSSLPWEQIGLLQTNCFFFKLQATSAQSLLDALFPVNNAQFSPSPSTGTPSLQGSLLFPKMEFFIKAQFEVWVFYKYAKLSFL